MLDAVDRLRMTLVDLKVAEERCGIAGATYAHAAVIAAARVVSDRFPPSCNEDGSPRSESESAGWKPREPRQLEIIRRGYDLACAVVDKIPDDGPVATMLPFDVLARAHYQIVGEWCDLACSPQMTMCGWCVAAAANETDASNLPRMTRAEARTHAWACEHNPIAVRLRDAEGMLCACAGALREMLEREAPDRSESDGCRMVLRESLDLIESWVPRTPTLPTDG